MKKIKLFGDKDYLIIKEKEIDGTLYTLFANMEDESDLCFRKTVVKDGEEFFVNLKDEEEVKKVLKEFID